MLFKAPKGEIFGFSIFWLISGLFTMIYGLIQGEITMGVMGGLLAVGSSLIWFDQKWIAPLMMIFFGLGAVARLVAIVAKGLTLASVFRLLMPLCFIYILWEWYRSERDVPDPITREELQNWEATEARRDPFSLNAFDTQAGDGHSSNPYRGNRPDER